MEIDISRHRWIDRWINKVKRITTLLYIERDREIRILKRIAKLRPFSAPAKSSATTGMFL
jgi:hypothetical protein